jgi:hypothetical protein
VGGEESGHKKMGSNAGGEDDSSDQCNDGIGSTARKIKPHRPSATLLARCFRFYFFAKPKLLTCILPLGPYVVSACHTSLGLLSK